MRFNKMIIINEETWNSIVKEIADEYGVDFKLVEVSLMSVLHDEKINKLKKSNKYHSDIIEIINVPKRKCTTLYNPLSFIEEYKLKTKERFSKKSLMR